MRLNPNAVVLWAAMFLTGYLVFDVRTGLIGLAGGLFISLLCSFVILTRP